MPVRIALIIAALTALTLALTSLFAGLFGILYRATPEEFRLCLGMLPANTPQCLGALVSASLARWVYDTHARIALAVSGSLV